MFIACFRREMILEMRIDLMAKNTPAKAKKLPKREQDKVQALKEDYLHTVFRKKQVLNSWKGWERLRRLCGFLAVISLLGFVAYGFFCGHLQPAAATSVMSFSLT